MSFGDFNILLQRLDRFIRRYYLNQIIRGIVLTLTITVTYFLVISFLEYLGNFNVAIRTTIFYASLLLLFIVLVYFFVRPLLGFLRIGRLISYKDAANILKTHFPEIQDKLLNTLELAEMKKQSPQTNALLEAAIAQKTQDLKPIPFLAALPLKASLKYVKYIIPPVVIFLLLLFFWPSVISEGTERIVKYKTEFIPPPPFEFQFINKHLSVRKGADFTVEVTTKGDLLPDKVWVNFNGNRFLMNRVEANLFQFEFKNLNNSLDIYFESGEVRSPDYNIAVLPAPGLLNYQLSIIPPAYTKENAWKQNNQGDVSVPVGSQVNWSFKTVETSSLSVVFSDSSRMNARQSESFFHADTLVFKSTDYYLVLNNENFSNLNPIKYKIHVIPDLYPEIRVTNMQDSTDPGIFYFNGIIRDDYGFNSLRFYYKDGDIPETEAQFIDIPFSRNQNSQEFYFAFDFSMFENSDITSVRYYFEVGDNDAIQGSKKTRSEIGEFRFPSKDELNKMNDEANQAIEDKINQAKDLSRKLRKDIQDLQRKLIDKNMSQFERQQSMKQIMENQNALEKLAQEISKQNEQRNQFMDAFSQPEEIVEKQKQIEELMENMMDEELRKMIEELNELMKENKTDEMQELMKDLDFSYEDLDKQLDNNLELLKRMEVEERVQNNIDQLKELSEKHEELSEKTKDGSENKEDLSKEQAEHQAELEKIQEDYEKTLEKNQDLKEPLDMENFQQQFDEIQQEMQEGKQNLEQNKQKKASENQQNSAQKMQKLSDDMQSMLNQSMMSSAEENMEDMRQLLENLIQFSFDQEGLLEGFQSVSPRDPRFREIVNRQSKLENHFSMIDDSLTALGARVPQIGSIIREEQKQIRKQLSEVMENISNNRIYNVRTSQQMIMMHANNLALLISEVLDQMQNQMNSMSNSDGQCQKKGGQGKPQMGEMRQRQQSLKNQLQQMLDMMKQGQKTGQKPSQSQMSKSLAKMLAEQEIMQQMLNEMMSDPTISPDAAKMLREINQMMEENKSDLVNKNITPNLLQRQEQIITRMLEAEKSEIEREIDKKRKSEEAREYKVKNPEKAFEQSREKARFNELLEFSNLKLNRYYKNKYQEYLLKISE
jgi:hypothetical protein